MWNGGREEGGESRNDLRRRLEESEARFRNVIEKNADGVLVVDVDGRIEFANPAACRLLGRSRDELTGIHFGLPEAGSDVAEIDLFPGGGRARIAEMRVVETEWKGRPAHLVSMRDISERKQTEKTLRESLKEIAQKRTETEALLACSRAILSYRVFEDAAKAVFRMAKRVIGAQSGYVALLNEDGSENDVLFLDSGGLPCTVDPALPMPIRGLRAEAYRSCEAVYDNRFAESDWVRFMPPGHVRLENVLFAPLVLEGKAAGLIGLANKDGGFTPRDARMAAAFGEYAAIALRNSRTLDELHRSERKHRSLFETSREGISFVSLAGRFETANPAYLDMFGYSLDELRKKRFQDLTAEPYRELEQTLIEDRVLKSGYSGEYEKECVRKDGTVFPVNVRRWLVRNEEGTPVRMMVQLSDATERKKMEFQLQQAQKLEAIGTLAGGIAHDFNNILSVILGNIELAMLETPSQGPAQKSLKEAITASLRARDLVNQILLIARRKEQQLVTISLGPAIKEAMKMLRSTLPTTVEIEQHIEEDLPWALADPSQIQQIVMNLCTNAAQAMEKRGGLLEVCLDATELHGVEAARLGDVEEGTYLRLRVRDTGPGMPPDILDRIFEPYFTTKDVGEGSGLGLAVVHGIVRARGGAVDVQSQPGRGAVFTVYIPATEQPEPAKVVSEAPVPAQGKERILFVDDEPSLMELGRKMLERFGYEVETKTCGTEALEGFRRAPDRFDLVVTDMTMPRMTGDRLAREILSIRPDTPVILCTGYNKQISEEEARKIGIRAFVMKPLTSADLASTVRRVLDETSSTTLR